jgi:hypothetical protein
MPCSPSSARSTGSRPSSASRCATSTAGRSLQSWRFGCVAARQALRQERDRQGDPLQPQALDRAGRTSARRPVLHFGKAV